MAADTIAEGLPLRELAPAGDLLQGKAEPMEKQRMHETTLEMLSPGAPAFSYKLFPTADELPPRPPPAIECNFTHHYAVDVREEFHDQYILRHANGLCVVGLAPTHAALQAKGGITGVDYNVGKDNRANLKASGKRKNNAKFLQEGIFYDQMLYQRRTS
jgi:hypothetical protein